MSQTWLASHTGPIEWSITSRGRFPRSAPPATRSQNPAPKSAPAEDGVGRDPDEQRDGDRRAHGDSWPTRGFDGP